MIFNPLFIDLEAKQINSVGQKSAKGSYLFRDIINLENSSPEERSFNTTSILSNLLTEVSNLSKQVDANDSQLNGLLASFRISGSQLTDLKNSSYAFSNDAPLLINSQEKLNQIIEKSIEGLAADFNFELMKEGEASQKNNSGEKNILDTKELISKLKKVPDEADQLSILFYNPDTNESFRLNVEKILAGEGNVDFKKAEGSSYLLSISAENFDYKSGNTPIIQKIIDANQKVSIKKAQLNSTSEKLLGDIGTKKQTSEPNPKGVELDLMEVKYAVKSEVKKLLSDEKSSTPPADIIVKELLSGKGRSTLKSPADIENMRIKSEESLQKAPVTNETKTFKPKLTAELKESDKVLYTNKKRVTLVDYEIETGPKRKNFVDKIIDDNKADKDPLKANNDKNTDIKIKLVSKKDDGYDELKTQQFKKYFEGSEKVSETSKVKYSPLLEKLTVISAKNLKESNTETTSKTNSINNIAKENIVPTEVNKAGIKTNESSHQLDTTKSTSNEDIATQRVDDKPKNHSGNDGKESSLNQKQESNSNAREINVKDKANFENVIKHEAKELDANEYKTKPETSDVSKVDTKKVEPNKPVNDEPKIKIDSKTEQDTESIKTHHKAEEVNSTNNNQNVFGKEIKTNNHTADVTQTVKVNPKELHQPQLNQKIVDEISDMIISDKKDKAIISLEPATLGKVKIMVELVDNKLTARVDVENQAAKEMLQNQIQFLKESLNSGGIQLSSLNISQQNSDNKGTKPEKERRRSEEVSGEKVNKDESKNGGSKNFGYNTYEYIA